MPPSVLALLSSPSGAKGGGATVPTLNASARSGATLDTSGSSYQLSSGTAGDLIVGGGKNNTWMILGAVALVAFFAFRK